MIVEQKIMTIITNKVWTWPHLTRLTSLVAVFWTSSLESSGAVVASSSFQWAIAKLQRDFLVPTSIRWTVRMFFLAFMRSNGGGELRLYMFGSLERFAGLFHWVLVCRTIITRLFKTIGTRYHNRANIIVFTVFRWLNLLNF